MSLLEIDDLTPFATIEDGKAEAMVADAVAMATLAAPCLSDTAGLSEEQLAAAKAVLRAAVLRWNDSGTGAISAQTAGPYSQTVDTRQPRRNMFWPSEITALQKICPSDSGAFSVDTAAQQPQTVFGTFGGWGHEGWSSWQGGWRDDGSYIPFRDW